MGGIVVLVISGPMDAETAPQLRDLVVRLIDEGHHRLVLDLSGVAFIHSIGLGVIVGVVPRLRPHEGSMAAAAPSAQVRHVLRSHSWSAWSRCTTQTAAAVSAVREGNATVSAGRRPGGQAPTG
jgi:anti-sigma B factor antagonist